MGGASLRYRKRKRPAEALLREVRRFSEKAVRSGAGAPIRVLLKTLPDRLSQDSGPAGSILWAARIKIK